MSKVKVYQANGNREATIPAHGKAEEAMDAVRRRAFELFEARGHAPGGDLDDWLRAERDVLLFPQAEVDESADVFSMKINAPGFDARDIEVIALPQELVVEAKTERLPPGSEHLEKSMFESRYLYTRFDLRTPIDTDKVTARIDEGELKIEAPKRKILRVAVSAAAA